MLRSGRAGTALPGPARCDTNPTRVPIVALIEVQPRVPRPDRRARSCVRRGTPYATSAFVPTSYSPWAGPQCRRRAGTRCGQCGMRARSGLLWNVGLLWHGRHRLSADSANHARTVDRDQCSAAAPFGFRGCCPLQPAIGSIAGGGRRCEVPPRLYLLEGVVYSVVEFRPQAQVGVGVVDIAASMLPSGNGPTAPYISVSKWSIQVRFASVCRPYSSNTSGTATSAPRVTLMLFPTEMFTTKPGVFRGRNDDR